MQQIKKLSSWVKPWNNSVTTSRASALLLPISQWRVFFENEMCTGDKSQVFDLFDWLRLTWIWLARGLIAILFNEILHRHYIHHIITYKNSGRKRNTPSSHLNYSNIILNFFFIFHILFSKFLMHESFSSHRAYHRQLFCNRQEVPKCV